MNIAQQYEKFDLQRPVIGQRSLSFGPPRIVGYSKFTHRILTTSILNLEPVFIDRLPVYRLHEQRSLKLNLFGIIGYNAAHFQQCEEAVNGSTWSNYYIQWHIMKFLLTIVSVSLNEDLIESVDKLKSLGCSGRSESIRAGIRNLLSDERMKEDLDGEINSLLLAVHDEDSDDQVSSIRHAFDKIIIVHLHNKIDKDRCLEIFSLKGDAKDIKAISRKLQINKKMHFVKLIVV
ncbi:MAG TPA: CopG family ribbon-helix-helix protein [Nitrososphaeraceae archaeon]|nr:CopG family ribbon-helix-helix protein [Nitrososphaeraceae archaeon]